MLRFVRSLLNSRRRRRSSWIPQGGSEGIAREATSVAAEAPTSSPVHVVHIINPSQALEDHGHGCSTNTSNNQLQGFHVDSVSRDAESDHHHHHQTDIQSQQVEAGGTEFSHSNEVVTSTLANGSDGLLGSEPANQMISDLQALESTAHITQLSISEDRLRIEAAGHTDKTFLRSISIHSTESASECCRVCQQPTDEGLVELGCQCRGELAMAHRSCIEQWFNNKGSNKCEICQHIATNLPCPASSPLQNFWVWRLGGAFRGPGTYFSRRGVARFHPLWVALLILIAGLLFDVLISISLGSSAVPVNIIIGVLIVLGLGTVTRLMMECWHEHNRRYPPVIGDT